MDDATKQDILTTYAAYAKAFLANDIAALDALVKYPLAYIGDGKVVMAETFPINPAELKTATQWHSTKDIAFEVVFASATKAHLILRHGTRIRADMSPIETVSAFYALTHTDQGWRIFAISDIAVPASIAQRLAS